MQTLGERIRLLRENQSMTQAELASMISVSSAVVSHYETGKREPSLSAFRRICAALRCDASLLLGSELLPDHAACPFCHGRMSEIDHDDTDDLLCPQIYYACCDHCGARGPLVSHAADAMIIARCRGNAMDLAGRLGET
ncbi:MAG: helix-turn-helix domain-containing protein [Halothiobacillaceae bacterium]